MTQTSILVIAGFLFFVCMAVALPLVLHTSAEEQRLQQIVATSRLRQQGGRRERLEESLLRLSVSLRGRLGLQLGPETRRRLDMAGYRTAASHEFYFALCWFIPLLGAYAGSFIRQNTVFCVLFSSRWDICCRVWCCQPALPGIATGSAVDCLTR